MAEEHILQFIQKNFHTINRNLSLMNHYVAVEISTALEELGVLEYAKSRGSLSVPEAAKTLQLKEDLLSAACEFLTEQRVLQKTGQNQFTLAYDKELLRWFTGFPLTYKKVFASSKKLLNGSAIYGENLLRNDAYFRSTRFITRGSVPYLLKRFKELGIQNLVSISWDDHQLLDAVLKEMPGLSAIGIDVPEGERISKKIPTQEDTLFKLIDGDAGHPEEFPPEAKKAEAVVATLVFHEFFRDREGVLLLDRYKNEFPRARFFMVEMEDLTWDTLRQEPEDTPNRSFISLYKLLHAFISPGLLPQSRTDVGGVINKSGWKLVKITPTVPARLLIYECE